MIAEFIDDRAEFVEWARARAKVLAHFNQCGSSSNAKEFANQNGRSELEAAILEALIEVYDRMAAGE